MTSLEMFTKVREHLLAQNARAKDGDGAQSGCAYRGVGGTKCAVGCLIPDALYDARMEGLSVDGLPEDFPGYAVTRKQFEMLVHLQYIHDEVAVSAWPDRLSVMEVTVRAGRYD